MKTAPISAEISDRLATFRRALNNPRMIDIAKGLNIDLYNINQQNSVVAQAEKNYEASALRTAAAPANGAVALTATPDANFSAHYVKSALHAYMQVAAL